MVGESCAGATLGKVDLVAVGKADCLVGGITKLTLLLRTACLTGGDELLESEILTLLLLATADAGEAAFTGLCELLFLLL